MPRMSRFTIEAELLLRELFGIGPGPKTRFDGQPDDGRTHTQPGRKLSYTSK